MKSRPWFLSLTGIWSDDADAVAQLNLALTALEPSAPYPHHQFAVRHEARHLTILAILRINDIPSPTPSFRDFSRHLISSITAEPGLLNRLTKQFGAGLVLDAYEIRAFDSGTAVQFQGTSQLGDFRDNAREILTEPVSRLVAAYPDGTIDPLVDDPIKSRGERAFGSIARSPSRSDPPAERFRVSLDPPVKFNFRRIHLLTSDEFLTNPRLLDAEDFIIGA
jgi:hypothetical protein